MQMRILIISKIQEHQHQQYLKTPRVNLYSFRRKQKSQLSLKKEHYIIRGYGCKAR